MTTPIPKEEQSSIPYGPFPVIEFLLIKVIRRGLQAVYADPTIIDKLFVQLTVDERQQMKDYLVAHQGIKVVHNFPASGTQLPIIALTLAQESEDASKEAMAYFVDELVGEDGIDIEEAHGLAMRSTYNIMIFTPDRDFTIHFYNLIKAILLINMDSLSANGMHDIQMSGSDFRLEQENHFPEFAYSRMLSVNALHYEVVTLSEVALRALRVTLLDSQGTVLSSILTG